VTASNDAPDGFLSRWSRRKAQRGQGGEPPQPAPVAAPAAATPQTPTAAAVVAQEPPPPAPTLDDVAQLTTRSDFRRFVAADATPEVRNAAMKKLFADPHFNVMDGLDTYIDDYGKPDPIPLSMLRQMVQSNALGLFADEEKDASAPAGARATPDGAAAADTAQSPPVLTNPMADDQDAALRLQPLDAAGPPGDPGGAGQDPGRQR